MLNCVAQPRMKLKDFKDNTDCRRVCIQSVSDN